MRAVLGDRSAAIARELTKVHEEVFRGTLSEAIAHFEAAGVRGEITIVVQGAAHDEQPPAYTEAQVRSLVQQLMDGGLSARDAVAEAARRTGWPRRRVYALAVGADEEQRT
jgi:16S rRNA (cytidine1402-2'-O)-methyltransferase